MRCVRMDALNSCENLKLEATSFLTNTATKVIQEKFRFHDIRRKAATEIEHSSGREQARKLLGHQDQKTTGIYISGAQRVKPVR